MPGQFGDKVRRGTFRGEPLTIARYRELVAQGIIKPGTAQAWLDKAAAGEEVRADKLTLFRGAPDWDDPRRCQSKKNHRRWAVRGSRYCITCGGANIAARYKANVAVRITGLPVFYSKRLSKTLSDAIGEMTGVKPDDQLALYEELALTRIMAGDALELWEMARSLPPENPKRNELVSTAESIVRTALQDVKTMCEAAARVRSQASGKISVHNLQYAVNQMVRIAYAAFGEDERAKDFEALVRQELKLLDEQRPGTDRLPGGDHEVEVMDDTVPGDDT